jgi:lysophospholipase L1-like esterase
MQKKIRTQIFGIMSLIPLIIGLFGGVFLQKYYQVGNVLPDIRNNLGITTNTPSPTNTLTPTPTNPKITETPTATILPPFFMFVGDSLTRGSGASDWAHTYPSQTMALIGVQNYINFGIGGSKITDLNQVVSTSIDLLINPAYQFVLLVWIGANDLGTPLSTFSGELESYWRERRAAGFKIIAFTVLPQGGINPKENERAAMNDWIRSNWATYCDVLVDVAVVNELQDPTNLTYYRKDQEHLTDAGYALVAKLAAQEVSKQNYGR